MPDDSSNRGRIVALEGSVVDVHFDHDLPPLGQMLRSGPAMGVVIEVAALTGGRTIRGLALNARENLALGMEAVDTGGPLQAPVGEGLNIGDAAADDYSPSPTIFTVSTRRACPSVTTY